MKISQLVSGFKTFITNEESDFIRRHGDQVKLSSLDEHDLWLAQGIVRKGLYNIAHDDNTLLRSTDEKHIK
jgi:hypothetical protein